MKMNEVNWYEVLPRLGIDKNLISNPRRQGPCPIERAGSTKFRFDNKGGYGTWICNHCGAGAGVKLVEMFLGISEKDAWKKIRDTINGSSNALKIPAPKNLPPIERSQEELQKARSNLNKTSKSSEAITHDSPAWSYISNRVKGLKIEWLSENLRWKRSMLHIDGESGKITHQHALVAFVVNAKTKKAVTIHRTYIDGYGKKASVSPSQVKKLMTPLVRITGESIKVNNKESNLIIVGEGIESALAWVAATKNNFAVYAALNCYNLGQFIWPEETQGVLVAGDNDLPKNANGFRPGIHYATKLYQRVLAAGLKTKIVLPHIEGVDFDDAWNNGVISIFDLSNFA